MEGGIDANNRGEQNKGMGTQTQARIWVVQTYTPEIYTLVGLGMMYWIVVLAVEAARLGGARHDGIWLVIGFEICNVLLGVESGDGMAGLGCG